MALFIQQEDDTAAAHESGCGPGPARKLGSD